jgi:lipid-binding SYLF domain-containing protein
MQQSKLALLRAMEGAEFDNEFLREFGIRAHQHAIGLFEGQQRHGNDPQLRRFAAETLPQLREHLAGAQRLMGDASAAGSRTGSGRDTARAPDGEAVRDARELIRDAVQTVQQMKRDPRVAEALREARAVYVVPHYGRGAIGVGGQGGEGVLVARRGDGFTDPLFYDLAGVSVGVQAGASGGPVAFLLMTDDALRNFRSGRNVSLHADAAVTVADWSRRAQVSGGKVQDVVIWSGAEGAFAGAAIGASSITFDADATRAYYGSGPVTVEQVMGGGVASPHSNVLGMVIDR